MERANLHTSPTAMSPRRHSTTGSPTLETVRGARGVGKGEMAKQHELWLWLRALFYFLKFKCWPLRL